MYQLLPFVCAYTAILPNLPVEIWCVILKLLDPASLLTTVRSSSLFRSIVHGDPTLRKMLEDAKRKEQMQIFAQLTQPRMTTRVSRQDYARLFSTNVQKGVSTKCRKVKSTEEPKLCKKPTVARKSAKNTRYNPYRL